MTDSEKIHQQKTIIESLLFISGDPLTISEIRGFTDLTDAEITTSLRALIHEYRERNGGILVVEVAQGYQMISNPLCSESVRRFKKTTKTTRLSVSSLETISIIAYKQPITRAEIEQIRGVNVDGPVKTLLERRLIKIVGRKEGPGRPLLYGTTRDFLLHFGLKDLSELPTLKEMTKEE